MRREVLLTGATGVLGSELLARFLDDSDTQVWLLLRAQSVAHAAQRANTAISYARPADASSARARVRVLHGDIAQPRLGLCEVTYARVADEITHVVHSAADVRPGRPLDDARRAHVGGLEHVLELVTSTRQSKKLDYVSTVGVAGRRRGVMLENPMPVAGQMFRNSYEQSKAEAEELLLSEMARCARATIHRPAMVIGHSKTGRIHHHQIFYFVVDFLLGLKGQHLVPDCDDIPMDTVPVDYVASSIEIATRSPRFDQQIVHQCSGSHAWSVGRILEHARALLRNRGVELPLISRFALSDMPEQLTRTRAQRSKLHDVLAQLQPFFEDRLEFDNRNATALLRAEGLELPNVGSYLGPVLCRYWDERGVAA